MTKEESMDEFFTCILNLVKECDRRFEDANLKVATYMLSRLKSCTASLQLLENAMKTKKGPYIKYVGGGVGGFLWGSRNI